MKNLEREIADAILERMDDLEGRFSIERNFDGKQYYFSGHYEQHYYFEEETGATVTTYANAEIREAHVWDCEEEDYADATDVDVDYIEELIAGEIG